MRPARHKPDTVPGQPQERLSAQQSGQPRAAPNNAIVTDLRHLQPGSYDLADLRQVSRRPCRRAERCSGLRPPSACSRKSSLCQRSHAGGAGTPARCGSILVQVWATDTLPLADFAIGHRNVGRLGDYPPNASVHPQAHLRAASSMFPTLPAAPRSKDSVLTMSRRPPLTCGPRARSLGSSRGCPRPSRPSSTQLLAASLCCCALAKMQRRRSQLAAVLVPQRCDAPRTQRRRRTCRAMLSASSAMLASGLPASLLRRTAGHRCSCAYALASCAAQGRSPR